MDAGSEGGDKPVNRTLLAADMQWFLGQVFGLLRHSDTLWSHSFAALSLFEG